MHPFLLNLNLIHFLPYHFVMWSSIRQEIKRIYKHAAFWRDLKMAPYDKYVSSVFFFYKEEKLFFLNLRRWEFRPDIINWFWLEKVIQNVVTSFLFHAFPLLYIRRYSISNDVGIMKFQCAVSPGKGDEIRFFILSPWPSERERETLIDYDKIIER